MFAKRLWAFVVVFVCAVPAVAGGPRFVAGSTSSSPGAVMAWRSDQPLQYFTDPGDLSSSVNHAQADAIVAAAVAVWNVPTSSLTLVKGGALAEHVSAANTTFDSDGVAFPADVAASNAAAKPIAVIYDTDGSITDMLMGAGASDPSSCRQNEVTESVDGFGDTTIRHAVLVINGRCVGSSHDQLMQMQYMVMRAVGRVIGLGWSQVNDNVFTGATVPTSDQMAHWPVMHPMDVICGPYTYLCMVNPFVLRDDDLSGLTGLYPVTASNVTAGKTLSMQGALTVWGSTLFPGSIGMDMVNVVVRRWQHGAGAAEPWQTASALSGLAAVKNAGNPVTGPEDPADDAGKANDMWAPMLFNVTRVPQSGDYILLLDVEPINPLYSGAYALGPFQRPPVTPSGTFTTTQDWDTPQSATSFFSLLPPDAANGCWTMGSENRPQAADPTGWWYGLICGPGQSAWGQVTIRAGHTWTLETMAVDDKGQTTQKLQPLMGVWKSTDPVGTLPTVAAEPIPMNATTPGMSQLTVDADSGDNTYRFTTTDAWGGGRPDFGYKARVLYADTVSPALVPAAGGQITITGMGFASGNKVTVNGVAAKVVSWTANQIVAIAPSMTVAKAQGRAPVEIAVLDAQTGGSTRMAGALSYPGAGALGMVSVSAPAVLETGVTAATPFAVKVLAADGVTPVPGASVHFAVTAGGAQLVGCGSAASCTLTANSLGIAQSAVTGLSAGNVILSATEVNGGVTVQASMMDADPVRSAVVTTPTAYVAAGGSASFPVTLQAVQDGLATGNVAVSWTTPAQGLGVSVSASATGANGAAAVMVSSNGMAAGSATVQGCAWTTVCATWTLVSVDASQWLPTVVSGAGQSVGSAAVLAPVVLRVTDAAGHPLAAATVSVAQTVYGWQGACPASGRCPAAPVLATQRAAGVTDVNGLVTVAPLQVSGVAQTVDVAVSTGTAGFVSLTLVKTP